jgi:Tfp pilus assembly protein PilF
MAPVIAISYVLAYPVVLVASFLLMLLLHEMGHALAALALAPGQVRVCIGSSDYSAGTWQRHVGRLEFCASRRLLDWRRGGYCQFLPTATTWRHVLIVLAGPALPLFVASAGFYVSMHIENGVHRLVTLVFLFIVVMSTLQTLVFQQSGIIDSDGRPLPTDGQLLRQLLWPSPRERQARQALRHFTAKRYAESIVLYRQLLAAPDPDTFSFRQLIYCCVCLHYPEEGLRANARFQHERAADYTDTDRSNGAVLLLQGHQVAAALAVYTALLAQEPPYLGAYNNRGYTYSQMGEYALAIADFDCAIAVGVYVADAYCNRAHCWLKLGQPAAAFRDLQQSLRLAPAAPDTHANLGLYYLELAAYSRALSFFEQAGRLGLVSPELDSYIQKTRQCLETASGTGG